jgi:hypothetical protein
MFLIHSIIRNLDVEEYGLITITARVKTKTSRKFTSIRIQKNVIAQVENDICSLLNYIRWHTFS